MADRPGSGANGGARSAPARAGGDSRTGAAARVLQKQSTHPCYECALCCGYVAIEIDAPTTNAEYDYIVWYLYHAGVSVFVDWEGDWFFKVESRCEHLTESGMCGVYEDRPLICREFSFEDCEKNAVDDDPPDKWLFLTADDFLGWLQKQRPKSYARFRKFQREKKRKVKTQPELRRVKITDVALPVLPSLPRLRRSAPGR